MLQCTAVQCNLLLSVSSGYPIPDPNQKFLPIQNLRVFRVSSISEIKPFSHFWNIGQYPCYIISIRLKRSKYLKHELRNGSSSALLHVLHFHFHKKRIKCPSLKSLGMPCTSSRLPCYVFCICLLTNKYQKYKSVELGDQLLLAYHQ